MAKSPGSIPPRKEVRADDTAAADSWFAHLAFEIPGDDTSNIRLEPVADQDYSRLP